MTTTAEARPKRDRRVFVLLGALVLLGGTAPAAPAEISAEQPQCTIVGTSGNDVLIGTSGDDVICGYDGDDTLEGRGGDDVLIGGRGEDFLAGNRGDDKLSGRAGKDTLFGGPGNDLLAGGGDDDTLRGGGGEDELHGSAGDDTLIGGDDADELWGGPGEDLLEGRSGDDTLLGGPDSDLLSGNQGDDVLKGQSGTDTLIGGPGLDVLAGGGSADTLRGGDDSDQLHGDSGSDEMNGGAGNDRIFGGPGHDLLEGRSGDDTLYGGDGEDRIAGNEGDDTLFGNGGDDELYGGDGRDLCIAGPGNHVIQTCDGRPWGQLGSDVDGQSAGDQFGTAVDMNVAGTMVVVGARSSDAGGTNSGQARVFQFDGAGWLQVGSDLNGSAAGRQFGSSVAMNGDGTTIAVGAPWGGTGRVRVLHLGQGGWLQTGNVILGEASGDHFGSAVALSEDGATVVIGARWNDGTAPNAGHVRAYRLSGSVWNQVGQDIDAEAANDAVGVEGSVAVSANGDTIAVGAFGNDGGGDFAGHVRVFQLEGSEWIQLGSDIDGQAGESSGGAVAMSADGMTVVIEASGNSSRSDRPFAGAARVHRFDGSTWVQLGNEILGEDAGDTFGASVAINREGGMIAIGTHNNDDNGEQAGHVRIFLLIGTDWIQVGGDLDGEAAGDWSGLEIAMNGFGNTVAIGAPYNDGSGIDSGHVRVYRIGG